MCSRVTFVNFTVTRSSLQSQCLNEVLKAERPDVDEKRSDLLKLQGETGHTDVLIYTLTRQNLILQNNNFVLPSAGEFQLRLRQLEKSLLQALNEVKGRILDDDTIITTLENLKKEAAEVTRKVEETDIVMAEVETVSQQYLTLSSACSSIYFTMEALNQVHTQPSIHFLFWFCFCMPNKQQKYIFVSLSRCTSCTNTPFTFSWTPTTPCCMRTPT